MNQMYYETDTLVPVGVGIANPHWVSVLNTFSFLLFIPFLLSFLIVVFGLTDWGKD